MSKKLLNPVRKLIRGIKPRVRGIRNKPVAFSNGVNQKDKGKFVKKIKKFFGAALKAKPVNCPFCKEVFAGVQEWGLHIKEKHCC